jgi:hypothetical protein
MPTYNTKRLTLVTFILYSFTTAMRYQKQYFLYVRHELCEIKCGKPYVPYYSAGKGEHVLGAVCLW